MATMKRFWIISNGVENKFFPFLIKEFETEFEDEEKYIIKGDEGFYRKRIFGKCEFSNISKFYCETYEEALNTEQLLLKKFIEYKEKEIKYLSNKISEKQKDVELMKTFLNN